MPQYHRMRGNILVQGNLDVTGTVTQNYVPSGGVMAMGAEVTTEEITSTESGAAPMVQALGGRMAMEPGLAHAAKEDEPVEETTEDTGEHVVEETVEEPTPPKRPRRR